MDLGLNRFKQTIKVVLAISQMLQVIAKRLAAEFVKLVFLVIQKT